MPLSREQVEHVSCLARLKLSPTEIEEFTTGLAAVVDHFGQIRAVPTEGVESHDRLFKVENVFREDRVRPSLPQGQVLGNAPDHDGAFFRLPKVIG